MTYQITTDLGAALTDVRPETLVCVEQHPDYPDSLVFQTLGEELYPRYSEWLSRYLCLNELFLLDDFVRLLEQDGWSVLFMPSAKPILDDLLRWRMPLEIDGLTIPNNGRLYPFQSFTLRRALERTGNPTSADRLMFVGWGTGAGKAEPVSEPVLTPTGWRRMGDLAAGDEVIGSDGRATRVVSVHPQGVQPVYRLKMNDGTYVRCNPDHLWSVRKLSTKKRGPTPKEPHRKESEAEVPWKTLSAKEIRSSIGRGGRRWQLPVLPVVHFAPQEDLPLNPYALGVFLGDGCWQKDNASVTTDQWIINHLGWKVAEKSRFEDHEYCSVGRIPVGDRDSLTALGLHGLLSHEKFIPSQYLMASPEDRLALLRGLLDTDGSPTPGKSSIEFSTTSPALRDGVADLVRGLGGKATVSDGRFTNYNHLGEKRQGRESWRVTINIATEPFLLPRKLERWIPPSKYFPMKTIVDVVDEGVSEEQVCIVVDAPDSLYVTRGHTLTHNTVFAAAGAQEMFNRGAVDLCLAYTLGPLKTNLARFLTNATTLRVSLPSGGPKKRLESYMDPSNQVFVINYEKNRFDLDALTELVRGKRVLFICDEASKLLTEGKQNSFRTGFDKLVKATEWDVIWPMSASVVSSNPLRYRDVFNLPAGTDNPLGTKADFVARYATEVRTFSMPTRYGSYPVQFYSWNNAALHEVRHRVSSRAMSVRKTDPAIRDLFKGLQTIVVPVQMSDQDRRLYNKIIDQATVAKANGQSLMPFYRLLRYVCNNPDSLRWTNDPLGRELASTQAALVTSAHSSKLEVFLDMVEDIRDAGDKTLVFTQWVTMSLELIASALKSRQIRFVTHHGSQGAKENNQAQHDFKNDPGITVFLSSDAGAHGLNMTEARYVIHYESSYSWDVMMQRSNRIDRADSHLDGLTSYVLVTEDSVEERVWDICNERRELASATVGTNEALSYESRSESDNLEFLIFGKEKKK